MSANVDIIVDEGRKRSDRIRSDVAVGPVQRGVESREIGRIDFELVDTGALVAKLTFEPEHAEIVTGDHVDVVALLVVEPERVAEGRVGRPDDNRRRRCLGGRVVDEQVGILILRDHDTTFDSDVAGAVAGSRRRCHCGNRSCGEKIFAHWRYSLAWFVAALTGHQAR